MPAFRTRSRTVGDARRIKHRLHQLAGLGSVVLLALLARVGWMQTTHTEHFAALSAGNHLRQIPVAPPRGLIFDRHGNLLADNNVQYGLSLVPAQVGDMPATLERLQALLPIRERELQHFRHQSRERRYETNMLKPNLSERDIARMAARLHQLPGVHLEAYPSRRYAYREATAHVLGYLSVISEQDREHIDLHHYRGIRHIGRTGIEHQYEAMLLGTSGLLQAEVNSRGRILTQRDRQAPAPGANLILTLDAELQRTANEALAGMTGAIVAIEPHTGDILALASAPGFDPHLFNHGLDAETYRQLTYSPKRPLLNRAIQGRYAPGSTIKPFMALAGLATGHATLEKRFFAGPHFKLPNYSRPFRDWKDEGHGWVTLASSITQSCDVYFYALAHRMGIDAIHDHLQPFGLGQRQQLDLPGERSGLLPSAAWKRQQYGQAWYPGETVNVGIGQGYLLVTPLQLAAATAALATRGIRMQPRLLRAHNADGAYAYIEPVVAERIALENPAWWDAVTAAMVDVVHAPNGTARRSGANAPYRIAGKTGTAQVISYGKERPDSDDIPEHIRDHSLFIAFAPAEQPRIALAVIVEHGGHGSTKAAPIARKLLDRYLLRPS